jgi:hypothetical protein
MVLAGFETISKRLREKDWKAVPAALELYRNPGTNVEAGLLRRRRAEGALWAKGLTTHDGATIAIQGEANRSIWHAAIC